MPKSILISYVEKDSYIHKLNPITKLVVLTCVILLCFTLNNFVHNLILFFLIIPLAYFAKLTKAVFRPFKYLFIFFVILFSIQSFFYSYNETPLFVLPFGIIIWKEGFMFSVNISARLLVMIVYGSLFVVTTHPGDLVSALRKDNLPFTAGYVIISTLQLIPRMQVQMETIIDAQKSRGLETKGSVINRLKAYVPLIGPLFIGSIQQAIERTMALEARAFSANTPKTNYRLTVMHKRDKIIMISVIIISVMWSVSSWLL
jgi:energy-coupling factor transport system permease protein